MLTFQRKHATMYFVRITKPCVHVHIMGDGLVPRPGSATCPHGRGHRRQELYTCTFSGVSTILHISPLGIYGAAHDN